MMEANKKSPARAGLFRLLGCKYGYGLNANET